MAILSLMLSYTRPLKSTAANMSGSYYLFGLANIVAYLWYEQLSVPILALELSFSLIGLAVQAPVVLWASYKLACYAKRMVISTSLSKL